MDFDLFIGVCAFFASFLLFCILAATQALAINCSNCTKSRQIPVNSPKTIPQSESFYSLDIFPDESASLSSLESTVRNMDKSTTASLRH